ncbi:GNAT family N-acetyltransferase [Phaeobacter sp. B1627]|uniref:GNAT family N-acetyltransferase n=1 Tax=Phaeobacter sp. B1627 TaxID=2583809 RepID=UPI00111B1536|nr:GNAT family N-acetyltransferase [Phaeobacter sp. B1627]TNJ42051.1 GNAT family N-acetyltransferase [Phaeobacter sp. B1627]
MTHRLRPATLLDAGQLGSILHRFEQETPWMPKTHSAAEAIAFCDRMIARGWVTVAERLDSNLRQGFLARDGDEVCALYVDPDVCGRGLGKALLDQAKAETAHLRLWTFQANTGAMRFYLREGFVEAGRSDGLTTDEGLPDVEYHWHRAGMNEQTEPHR